MIMTPPVITARAARLLLMDAQGLLADPDRKATPAALRQLIERMGFVQLDSIDVIGRAHHLTLWSRFRDYKQAHFTALLEKRHSLFEQWTHDASAIPTKWFAQWKPRFVRARERIRRNVWWQQRIGDEPEKVLELVRERILREGPLRSQDFEHERAHGASSAWWGWKPQKAALEFLWSTGELMVARREKFQKVYDLTERVLPAESKLPEPSTEEHLDWACSTALERLVVATPKEIAEFWATIELAQARAWCAEMVRKKRLASVLVESLDGSKPRQSFAAADWEQRLRTLPDPPQRMRLLSPFDPVLRDRARARKLFGFDYRFEAFVPEDKRRYGYYVLPILEGERLVGRLDPKFHRRESLLSVRRIYWEEGIRVTASRRKSLEKAVAQLAEQIGAHKIALPVD